MFVDMNLSQCGQKVKMKTQKSYRGMSDTDSGRTREMVVIPREKLRNGRKIKDFNRK